MIHDKSYVQELIRDELSGKLGKTGAARLRVAWMLYSEEEMEELEWQALRELAGNHPPAKRPDAKGIIRGARRARRRRLWSNARRGAAAAVATAVLVAVSYFFGEGLGRRGEGSGRKDWAKVVNPIPSSEFACEVHWGDSERIAVFPGSTGLLGRIGGVELWSHGDGALELVPLQEHRARSVWSRPDIRITTQGQQQAVVMLPGGYRLRLDANTTLSYPLMNLWQVQSRIRLQGQALIQAKRDPARAPADLVVETDKGMVTTRDGTFTLLANRWDTRVVLLEGTAAGVFPVADGKRLLSNQGEMAHFDSCCIGPDGKTITNLSGILHADLRKALAWMGQTRDYKNVPLRDFVAAELGRWNGIETGSLSCIPENLRISVSVSYQESVETIYAHLHELGITFHEHERTISFCGPQLDPLRFQPPRILPAGNGVRELLDGLYDPRGSLADIGKGRPSATQ